MRVTHISCYFPFLPETPKFQSLETFKALTGWKTVMLQHWTWNIKWTWEQILISINLKIFEFDNSIWKTKCNQHSVDFYVIGLFQKKSKDRRGAEDILFYPPLPPSPGVYRFVTLPLDIPKKMSSHSRNSAKFCYTPWKFQGQKPRTMEIQQHVFLNAPRNFSTFLIDPWSFDLLFLQYPWNSMSSTSPTVWIFYKIPHSWVVL